MICEFFFSTHCVHSPQERLPRQEEGSLCGEGEGGQGHRHRLGLPERGGLPRPSHAPATPAAPPSPPPPPPPTPAAPAQLRLLRRRRLLRQRRRQRHRLLLLLRGQLQGPPGGRRRRLPGRRHGRGGGRGGGRPAGRQRLADQRHGLGLADGRIHGRRGIQVRQDENSCFNPHTTTVLERFFFPTRTIHIYKLLPPDTITITTTTTRGEVSTPRSPPSN